MNTNDDQHLIDMYKSRVVSLRKEIADKDDYILHLEGSINSNELMKTAPEEDLRSILTQVSGSMDLYRYLCDKVPGISCSFTGTRPVRYTIIQPGCVPVTGVGENAVEAFVESCKKFMLQFQEVKNSETGQLEEPKRPDVPDAF